LVGERGAHQRRRRLVEGKRVTVRVQDTGKGMSEGVQRRAFEPLLHHQPFTIDELRRVVTRVLAR